MKNESDPVADFYGWYPPQARVKLLLHQASQPLRAFVFVVDGRSCCYEMVYQSRDWALHGSTGNRDLGFTIGGTENRALLFHSGATTFYCRTIARPGGIYFGACSSEALDDYLLYCYSTGI
jgi:hypothetical protein